MSFHSEAVKSVVNVSFPLSCSPREDRRFALQQRRPTRLPSPHWPACRLAEPTACLCEQQIHGTMPRYCWVHFKQQMQLKADMQKFNGKRLQLLYIICKEENSLPKAFECKMFANAVLCPINLFIVDFVRKRLPFSPDTRQS